jgi:hypothetical protein
MTVVNEDGACSGSISLNSVGSGSDVLADCRKSLNPAQCQKDKDGARARAAKARQEARDRLRKILEENGYDVDESDIE